MSSNSRRDHGSAARATLEALGELQGATFFEINGTLQKREGVHFQVRALR